MTIICRVEECPWYRQADHPMKVYDETERHWVFQCQRCLNLRTVDKFKIGGTIGQGRKDDEPVKKYLGRGFHALR